MDSRRSGWVRWMRTSGELGRPLKPDVYFRSESASQEPFFSTFSIKKKSSIVIALFRRLP
eukprot:scaffold208099_cov12-Tisochrysis_lutea.AAC.1